MTSQQRKRKILLVPDIPGWAFDHHAKDMMEMPSNKVQLDLKYSNQVTIEDSENYDLIYAMAVIMAIDFYKLGIPLDKMIGGISSMRQFRFFENEDKTFTKEFEHVFKGLRAVNTASQEFVEYFKPYRKVHKTRVGINHRLFKPLPNKQRNKQFTVGWVGSSTDNSMKGFRFVKEALKDLNVKIDIRTRKDKFVTRKEMISFYQGLDCFICSSSSEHIPLPVLEAAACGVPIVSTKVGIVPELIKPYENGIIVERNAASIRKAVTYLIDHPKEHKKMAKNIRETIMAEWTWDKCWKEWEEFFATI